ncbi:MAG: UPF0182 family protein [Bryobacteraceae bacterium]|nr:UPF0182 family protein [Bryobacteraceae bacterium]
MAVYEIPTPRPRRISLGAVVIALFFLLFFARNIAGLIIDYAWWQEIGQLELWYDTWFYASAPIVAGAVLLFAFLFAVHARGLKSGGGGLGRYPQYARLSTLGLLVLSVILAFALIDAWTIARYFGARDLGGTYRDPVFQRSLAFHFFEVPFFRLAIKFLSVAALVGGVIYWLASEAMQLLSGIRRISPDGFDLRELNLGRALDRTFVRVMAALFFLSLAAGFYLDRYDLLRNDHGLLVGVDYVDEHFTIPLLWMMVAASVAAAAMFALRWRAAALGLLGALYVAQFIVPRLVYTFYVKPSEITIQKPYIERHLEATRAAYGLTGKLKEVDFGTKDAAATAPLQNRALLDNVRLWDVQPFYDAINQIQALRPYYVFADSDVDRYWVTKPDGTKELQQVLLSPREIDVRQVPEARSRWNNPHFVYTHGYGVVAARANQATADGLPDLFIRNAPPEITQPGFKITRPEIYYGEKTHEPVFVRTGQQEFNYPAGADNVHFRYDGKGGFPVSSFGMRFAAMLRESDWNILFTQFMTPESRMMIHRNVRERVDTVASFIDWDTDPYLVITEEGRLVWMLDGYTTSQRHPYSRSLQQGAYNYLRNSVKATVDAYDGSLKIYVFEPNDPVIQVYQRLFPKLFTPSAEMPANLRAHLRYPEIYFRAQAEIFRQFHMRDAEAFYNKEDVWDLAMSTTTQEGGAQTYDPTYVVTTLPGSGKPEFALTLPFTPRSKQNLIGVLLARCDEGHYGELMVLQLSKQELIYGPMQIKARINQDQTISKDLSLWNQQGSKVLLGQTQVVPLENSFLYVEPIYLQAAQAPMPQLKKVALALGNQIAYADTYEQALSQLRGQMPSAPAPSVVSKNNEPAPAPPSDRTDRVEALRQRFRRYRELQSQGKFAEAGKQLEEIEALLGR